MNKIYKFKQKAFTLLEMLLVITIIAILVGIVIVAINPGRQLAQARNTERASDLKAIYSAVNQYYIDNKAWPTSTISSTLTDICKQGVSETGNNCINLDNLVPDYLSTIPFDPQSDSATSTDYNLSLDPNSQMLALTAPNSIEYNLPPVEIGTTSLSYSLQWKPSFLGNLEFWLPFDNNILDYSANNWQFSGTSPQYNQNAVVGEGWKPQTSGSSLTLNDNVSLRPQGGNFTFAFWLKPDNSSTAAFLITKMTSSGEMFMIRRGDTDSNGAWLDGQRLLVRMRRGTWPTNQDRHFRSSSGIGNPFAGTDWRHIVVTVEYNNKVSIYYNSSPMVVSTIQSINGWPIIDNTGPWVIHKDNWEIDDLLFFEKALSESEILELYNNSVNKNGSRW